MRQPQEFLSGRVEGRIGLPKFMTGKFFDRNNRMRKTIHVTRTNDGGEIYIVVCGSCISFLKIK
jgi:hypothetical protein